MNERIEELKLKAIDFADATYKYDLSEGFKIQEWDAIRLNEFAKLIVRECMEISYEYDFPKMSGPGMIIAGRIEQHFGVE
jgi:hypothetical protein